MGIADQFREKAERLRREAGDRLGDNSREEPRERGDEAPHRGRETAERDTRSKDEERERHDDT